jgi:hypothetical protein
MLMIFGGQSLTFYVLGVVWRGFARSCPRVARGIRLVVGTLAVTGAVGVAAFGIWYGTLMLESPGTNVAFLLDGRPLHVESSLEYQSCISGIAARQAEEFGTKVVFDEVVMRIAPEDARASLGSIAAQMSPGPREAEVARCRSLALERWRK